MKVDEAEWERLLQLAKSQVKTKLRVWLYSSDPECFPAEADGVVVAQTNVRAATLMNASLKNMGSILVVTPEEMKELDLSVERVDILNIT